ncbi:hypothetical protein HH310_28350 [Actinoplanes sp. TBRC 11911]|uniref:hypothetical protein n=1 Tax=Actinoplanes sp. TBRC 11911 TaxID=2729386 RepID=UPI00145CBEFC|nr:hypothetical protein [Actinoplanes sp. TBRC 11911]NMO55085.1 hypothetical protein [Actinoplanes sp. TBRC 11911]
MAASDPAAVQRAEVQAAVLHPQLRERDPALLSDLLAGPGHVSGARSAAGNVSHSVGQVAAY